MDVTGITRIWGDGWLLGYETGNGVMPISPNSPIMSSLRQDNLGLWILNSGPLLD